MIMTGVFVSKHSEYILFSYDGYICFQTTCMSCDDAVVIYISVIASFSFCYCRFSYSINKQPSINSLRITTFVFYWLVVTNTKYVSYVYDFAIIHVLEITGKRLLTTKNPSSFCASNNKIDQFFI